MSSDTWVWTLSNYIANSAVSRCDSPCFRADGHQVVITAQKVPGHHENEGATLWLYVCMPQYKLFPPMLSFRCVRKITIVHAKNQTQNVAKPKNDRIAQFHSRQCGSWGLEFPKIRTLMDDGFLFSNGSLKVEVQFFPAMFVKWSIPNFSSLSEEQESPPFTTQGCPWRLSLHPKDGQRKPGKRGTHVSAYFRCLAIDCEWDCLKVHAQQLSLACVDQYHNQSHPFSRADAVFSAGANKWGTHQLMPLSALRSSKADWLLGDKMEVVAEIRLKSVIWSLDSVYCVAKNGSEYRESPAFTLGSHQWKACAMIKPMRKEGEKDRVTSLTIAVSFVNPVVRRGGVPHNFHTDDFVVRPGFQMFLSDSNGLVQTMEVDADNRFEDPNGGISWGSQCILPYLPNVAAADPAPIVNVRMTLASRPSSVSWAIPNFSFAESAWYPLVLKSGKLICDGYESELHLYPHGNGDGRGTHVSIYLSRKLVCDHSRSVVRKTSLSGVVMFSTRRDRAKHSVTVAIPDGVEEGQAYGASKFLDLKDVAQYLDSDGSLRIDVLWGASLPSTYKPISACCEQCQSESVGPSDLILAEKKRRELSQKRTEQSNQLTDFDKAAKMMASWHDLFKTWTVPSVLGRDIERAHEGWTALSVMQDDIRNRVAKGLSVDYQCGERNNARRVFCERMADVELNYKDCDKLDTLAKQDIPIYPGIESKYPEPPRSDCSAIREAMTAVGQWRTWKEDWEVRKNYAAIMTDDAAKLMRCSLFQLFNTDSTAPPCSEEKIHAHYCALLHRVRDEELVLAETGPYFPIGPVVDVYYGIKEKMENTKAKIMELWNAKEEMVKNVRGVEKWLDGKPDTALLARIKNDRRRNQLMAARYRLEAQNYDIRVEIEDNEALQVSWKRILEVEMQGVEMELDNINESYREDFNRLWELKRSHFPELSLPPRITVGDDAPKELRTHSVPARISPRAQRNACGRANAPSRKQRASISRLSLALTPLPKDLQAPAYEFQSIFSDRRFLDMYDDRRHSSASQRIFHATFMGSPCVLKKFSTNDEMLREAKIQHKLRHPSVIPIEAAFPDTDGSYIQLPVYKSDLLVWLKAKRITSGSTLTSMIANIVEAASHIHSKDLVHGDLHARNFLIDERGDQPPRLVLCGFGKASTLTGNEENSDDFTPRALGEHGYLAPELIRFGSRPTKETDMYSIGCIILKDLLPRFTGFLENVQSIRDAANTLCSREEDDRPGAMLLLSDMLRLS